MRQTADFDRLWPALAKMGRKPLTNVSAEHFDSIYEGVEAMTKPDQIESKSTGWCAESGRNWLSVQMLGNCLGTLTMCVQSTWGRTPWGRGKVDVF